MENEPAEKLARRESFLRSAQADLRNASPETYVDAAHLVEAAQGRVDNARSEFLPEACQDALRILVDHASNEWLASHPSPTGSDPETRRAFAEVNIKIQLLRALFHPELELKCSRHALNPERITLPRTRGPLQPGPCGA